VLLYLENGECDPASRRAVDDLVRRNAATLTLMSTVDDSERAGRCLSGTGGDVERELGRRLTTTAEAFDSPVLVNIEQGVPAISIVRRVLRGEADLVITVDNESPPAPNTQRLLRKCPCPVWVLRPDAMAGTERGPQVVAAVNPVPHETDLNLLILELASSMVERSGGVLHVVHAWETIGSATMSGRTHSGRFGVSYDELMIQARSRRADELDELLARLRPYEIERHVHLVHGAPDSAIPSVLHDVRADVLVMGTVARTGIRGLLIGNTAERVLASAACSLMAVKPSAFESPIGLAD
jgi:nucleotide-binding universal stress UspA family protein